MNKLDLFLTCYGEKEKYEFISTERGGAIMNTESNLKVTLDQPCNPEDLLEGLGAWVERKAKKVVVRPYWENPKLKKIIEASQLRRFNKWTFGAADRANLVVLNCPGVLYVDGSLEIDGIFHEHAWNKFENFHFDLTVTGGYVRYHQIFALDYLQILDSYRNGVPEKYSLLEDHYLRRVLPKIQ